MITVTRAMGAGTAPPGSASRGAQGRELATAFDQMADTLDRQEQLRRDLVFDVAQALRTPVAILR
jgi:signal transduction histidine kinase